jgi:xylose dehydrogenase (NAD/NADP)
MNTVRWGLISTARINRHLIPAIRKSRQGELVAVASRDLENARAYARHWHIPRAFGSYQELLESGEVDAVYISLPNHLHAEWTVKALKAGIHVLCEKPFAISLEEVDDMIRAAHSSGCVLAEALMYRHHPQTLLVKKILEDGNIGDILILRGAFTFHLSGEQRQPGRLNVRLVPDYGGGSLWDVGIYPLSYFQLLMGDLPAWVFGSQLVGNTGVDEVFSGLMGYQPGPQAEILAQFSCSFNAPQQTFVEIVGTSGRLFLNHPFNNMEQGAELIFYDHKGKPRRLKVPKKALYLGEVEDIQTAILEKKAPRISLEETRDHVRTILALYQSAGKGTVIKMADQVKERS